MTMWTNLSLDSWVSAGAWTLAHFIWQGALIWLLAAVGLRGLRRHDAGVRYVVCTLVLMALVATPAITFVRLLGSFEVTRIAVAAPASSQTEALAAQPFDFLQLQRALVGVWAMGALFLVLRLLIGWCRIQVFLNRLPDAPSRVWGPVTSRLAGAMRLARAPAAFEVACITVPTTVGLLRPVILLPIGMMTGMNTAQIEAIIAHELAHIRRRDHLVNLLQSVVEALLFFHPVVWWVGRRLRAEREYCCDDLAVAVTGDALTFARALAELEQRRAALPQLVLASTGGSLMERIARLIAPQPTPRRGFTPGRAIAGLALLGLAAASSSALAFVQTGPTSDRDDPQREVGAQDLWLVHQNAAATDAYGQSLLHYYMAWGAAPQDTETATAVEAPEAWHDWFHTAHLGIDPRLLSLGDAATHMAGTNCADCHQSTSQDVTDQQTVSFEYLRAVQRLQHVKVQSDTLLQRQVTEFVADELQLRLIGSGAHDRWQIVLVEPPVRQGVLVFNPNPQPGQLPVYVPHDPTGANWPMSWLTLHGTGPTIEVVTPPQRNRVALLDLQFGTQTDGDMTLELEPQIRYQDGAGARLELMPVIRHRHAVSILSDIPLVGRLFERTVDTAVDLSLVDGDKAVEVSGVVDLSIVVEEGSAQKVEVIVTDKKDPDKQETDRTDPDKKGTEKKGDSGGG